MSITSENTEKPSFSKDHLDAMIKGPLKIQINDKDEVAKNTSNKNLIAALDYLEKNPEVIGMTEINGYGVNTSNKTLIGDQKIKIDSLLIEQAKQFVVGAVLNPDQVGNVRILLDVLASKAHVLVREKAFEDSSVNQNKTNGGASGEGEERKESKKPSSDKLYSPPLSSEKKDVSNQAQNSANILKVENLVKHTVNKRSKTRKRISESIDEIIASEKISEADKLARVIDFLEVNLSKTKVSKKTKILKLALSDYKQKYAISDEQLEKSRLNKENIHGIIDTINKKMKEGTFTYEDHLTLQALMLSKNTRRIIRNSELKMKYKESNSESLDFISGSLIQKSIDLYANLNQRDLLEKSFDEDKKLSYAKLVSVFNQTQKVILNSMLDGNVDQRTLTLEHWIRVANKCLHNNPPDVFTTHLILTAIDSNEVKRLQITEQGLSDEARKMREEIRDLFNPNQNMKSYDDFMKMHPNAIPTPQKFSKDFILFDASKPEGVARDNYDMMYKHLSKVRNLFEQFKGFTSERKFNPDGLLKPNITKMQSTTFGLDSLQYSSLFLNEDPNAPGHAEMREKIKQKKDSMLDTKPYLNYTDAQLEEERVKKTKNAIDTYFNQKSLEIDETDKNAKVKKSKIKPKSLYRTTSKPLFAIKPQVIADIKPNNIEALATNILKQKSLPDTFKFNINDQRENVGFNEYAVWIYENKNPKAGELDPMHQPPMMKALAAAWLILNNPEYFNPKASDEKAIYNAKNNVDLTKVFLDSLSEMNKTAFINLLKQTIPDKDLKKNVSLLDVMMSNSTLPSELKVILLTTADPTNQKIETLKQDKTLGNRLDKVKKLSQQPEAQSEQQSPQADKPKIADQQPHEINYIRKSETDQFFNRYDELMEHIQTPSDIKPVQDIKSKPSPPQNKDSFKQVKTQVLTDSEVPKVDSPVVPQLPPQPKPQQIRIIGLNNMKNMQYQSPVEKTVPLANTSQDSQTGPSPVSRVSQPATASPKPQHIEWERFNHFIDAAIKECVTLQQSRDMGVFLEATDKMLELEKIRRMPQGVLKQNQGNELFQEVLVMKKKNELDVMCMIVDKAIDQCKILENSSDQSVSKQAKDQQIELKKLKETPESITKNQVMPLAESVVKLKQKELQGRQEGRTDIKPK